MNPNIISPMARVQGILNGNDVLQPSSRPIMYINKFAGIAATVAPNNSLRIKSELFNGYIHVPESDHGLTHDNHALTLADWFKGTL